MTLAGLFLIVAALLKAKQITTFHVGADGFWESWLFYVIQIPLEIGLGVWLLSGLFRKAAWLLGTLAYFGFIVVTGYKVYTGAESCGCFGAIEVSPVITLLVIDIPFFLTLAIFRPKSEKLFPPPWPHALHVLIISIPTCLFIGALTAAIYVHGEVPKKRAGNLMGTPRHTVQVEKVDPNKVEEGDPKKVDEGDPKKVDEGDPKKVDEGDPKKVDEGDPKKVDEGDPKKVDEGDPKKIDEGDPKKVDEGDPKKIDEGDPKKVDEEDPVAVEVERKRWPWFEHTDIADELKEGMVIIMCHRHTCEICEEAVPDYLQIAKDLGVGLDEDSIKMAFLEIPPYGKSEHYEIPEDTKCLLGKLAEGVDDFDNYPSPVIFTLIDGEMYHASDGEDEIPDMDALLASFDNY